MRIVRDNLMNRSGYTPYCGAEACTYRMPRTFFKNGQFECLCGWRSSFEPEFINKYEAKWSITMGLSVKRRREIERAIVARIINLALQKGYFVTINNGGDDDEIRASTDQIELNRRIMASDEDVMSFQVGVDSSGSEAHLGFIHFVYGNDGYDVISDYTSNRYMRELVIECSAMIATYETEAIHAK